MLFREWASRYPPASSNCRHTHKPVARVWKVSSAACSSYPACESAERRSQKGQRVTRPETAFSNNVVGGKHFSSEGTARKGRAKLRVAVDVDEVLGRFLLSLNKYCLEEYGLEYDISHYREYDFAKVWGCTLDEANHRVHKFFKSHHFAVGILPIPGALHSLQRLQESCDLLIVTSRQHIIRQPTLQWIAMHFPDVFQEVHFGNHWALSGESRKKSDICRDIGATVLIDDNPRYAMDCAEAGMQVLLYDWQLAYPWAKTADGPVHPLIRRVKDWNEVEQQLGALARQSTC